MTKSLFRIGLSIGVSVAILALLFHLFTTGLPEGDRPTIGAILRATSINHLLGFLVLTLTGLFVRAYRYRLLIAFSGEKNVPSIRQMILVAGIRNMVVDMLPARLGELTYVGLLNRVYGVKLQHCASSLSITIALDFIALLVILSLIVVRQLLGNGVTDWAIIGFLIALSLSAVAITGLFLMIPWCVRIVTERWPNMLEQGSRWRNVFSFLLDFNQSLRSIARSEKAGLIVGVSVLIRFLKYLGFYLLFLAVSVNSFPQLSELPIGHVVSALIGGEISSSLPIPTFMSFGIYEAGSALVFQLLDVADQAATFTTMLCVHIWSQMIEYCMGGMFIFILFNSRDKISCDNK